MTDKKIHHLEMIQSNISRMASNSFIIKGWAVTLVAGVFALASDDVEKGFFFVAFIPIIAFWLLDSYYLMIEKRYRILYQRVRFVPDDDVDFDMDASKYAAADQLSEYVSVLSSTSELILYVPLALATLIAIFIFV